MAGLLVSILTLPYAPVRAVVSLAEVLRREAEREFATRRRRQLEELDEQLRSGQISAGDYEQAQNAALNGNIGAAQSGGGDRPNPQPGGGR
jgi:hypothetical protein